MGTPTTSNHPIKLGHSFHLLLLIMITKPPPEPRLITLRLPHKQWKKTDFEQMSINSTKTQILTFTWMSTCFICQFEMARKPCSYRFHSLLDDSTTYRGC